MIEQMKWETVYELWERNRFCFPKLLSEPVSAETAFVECKQGGYIDGYDWLEAVKVQERKQLIRDNPIQFLYFTEHSNKGTIRTAELLTEAQDKEELAAVWIAATAKELSEYHIGGNVGRYAIVLHMATCEFLRDRYFFMAPCNEKAGIGSYHSFLHFEDHDLQ